MKSLQIRSALLIAFLLLVSGISIEAQSPESPKSLFDLADIIAIPRYPRMAVATGQAGIIKASICVSPNGTCEVKSISDGPRFLLEGVRKSLNSLSFLQGKTPTSMVLTFEFVLLPNTASEAEVQSEIFPELNKLVIKSRRPTLLTITDPAALP